jgi:hypothetical protein
MAKKKISGLPAGSALNGTELVPIVQTGTTKRITTQDIANLGNASGVEGSGTIGTLAKFTASSTIGNSALVEASSYIQSSKRIEADDAGYGLVAFSSSGNRQVVLGVNAGEPAIQGTLLNGTPRQLQINPSGGSVGIGIAPKIWASGYTALQVLNTSLFGSSALDLNLGSNMYLDNVGYKYISSGYATLYNQYQGKHFWSTTGTGTADGAISFTEVMTLTSAGNLGLGKTAPLGILHLYKAGATTRMVIDGDAAQSRIITYRTGGVQRFGFYVNNTAESGANAGSDFQIRAYSDAGTLLSTPLFIKRSSGNVLIGTTTDAGYKFDVNGDARILTSLRINGAAGDAYSTKISTVFDAGGQIIQSFIDSNAGTAWQGRLFFRTSANGSALTTQLTIANDGTSTFAGSIAIGNAVNAGVAVASTHKVTIVIGGVTYYLLASNV